MGTSALKLTADYFTDSLAPAATPKYSKSSCCNRSITHSINQSINQFFHPPGYVLKEVDEVPEFLKTLYIKTGYRVMFPLSLAFRSVMLVHNETLNVWTHLIGLIVALYLWFGETMPLLSNQSISQSVDVYDYIVFNTFYFSTLLCFFASSLYHLLSCHSPRAHSCLYLGDMSMIGCLIVGSYTPGLYYGFYCRDFARNFYIFVIMFLAAFYFALQLNSQAIKKLKSQSNVLSTRQDRHWLRVSILVLLVSFAVIPAVHFAFIASIDHPSLPMTKVLIPLIEMLLLYFAGFLFYVSHFPERWYPRKFDILFASHQWWHTCIVLAVIVWHYNIIQVFEHKSQAICYRPH